MIEVAEKSGLGREILYKTLSPNGNPMFSTIMKTLGIGFNSYKLS